MERATMETNFWALPGIEPVTFRTTQCSSYTHRPYVLSSWKLQNFEYLSLTFQRWITVKPVVTLNIGLMEKKGRIQQQWTKDPQYNVLRVFEWTLTLVYRHTLSRMASGDITFALYINSRQICVITYINTDNQFRMRAIRIYHSHAVGVV